MSQAGQHGGMNSSNTPVDIGVVHFRDQVLVCSVTQVILHHPKAIKSGTNTTSPADTVSCVKLDRMLTQETKLQEKRTLLQVSF